MYKITDTEFKKLANYIRDNYGINLRKEKKLLVIGRLGPILTQLGFNNFTQYYEYIISDKTGAAVTTLLDRITTNHTYFMREVDHFYYLRDHVLPYLKINVKDKDLRIWSAGCSSGEEPYTIAMILDEFFGTDKRYWDTKILATDISNKILNKAKMGIYKNESIASMPPQWRLKYFKKIDNDKSIIKDNIKSEVIFRNFNLMEPIFPFKKKFHVIFCR
ncbi:MAG: protein-glutamate O-methyltransferase CheR, partial [Clostridiales bacterium]|nr:protein-glutamate O-methyltransferase CheR [Clostridiales bacterium]